MTRASLALAVVLVAAAPAAAQVAPTATARPRIARIEIERKNVFDRAEAEKNILYYSANYFHIVTQKRIVESLLLFERGDLLDPKLLEETERNLRDTDFITAATVTATIRPDGDADVRVVTRDKWSIRFGAGVSLSGGIGKFQADVGDSNLLGLGKSVNLSFQTRTDERTILRGAYEDPLLFGTRIRLLVGASVSDLGFLYAASLRRPFFARETPYAWSGTIGREDSDFEYFEDGDVIATVHRDVDFAEVTGGLGFGPTESVKRIELEVELERAAYDPPEGEGALLVRWPRNHDLVNVKLRPRLDRLGRFRKLDKVDTNRFVEDVPVGFAVEALGGVQVRDDSRGTKLEALLGLGGEAYFEPFADHVLALDAELGLRHDGDAQQAHLYTGGLRYFLRLPQAWQTLALNCDFTSVIENEDLEAQLTLGEDNGLRGYEARKFTGTERLRVNIEDRIFTDLSILKFYFGFAVFMDMGLIWTADRSAPTWDDFHVSAGFGLRVFSSEFLKRRVIRVDVAFPFDPEGGPGVSVSFSANQVFTLFGTVEELSTRF